MGVFDSSRSMSQKDNTLFFTEFFKLRTSLFQQLAFALAMSTTPSGQCRNRRSRCLLPLTDPGTHIRKLVAITAFHTQQLKHSVVSREQLLSNVVSSYARMSNFWPRKQRTHTLSLLTMLAWHINVSPWRQTHRRGDSLLQPTIV